MSDGDALQYTATAFNGADLETGSIFSKDDDLGPDEERWRKRFRRRVKVLIRTMSWLVATRVLNPRFKYQTPADTCFAAYATWADTVE